MKKLSSTSADRPNNNGSHSNNNKNDENQLFQKIDIPDSPFHAIKMDNLWFLTMGKYRLTEPLPSYEDVENEAYSTTWHRIMQIIQIMIDEDKKKSTHTPQTNTNN